MVGGGAAVGLAATAVLATGDVPLPGEAAVFETVNGLPDGLEPGFVAVQQLGTRAGIVVLAVGLGLATRSARTGLTAGVAGLVAWIVSNWLKVVFDRPRPLPEVVDLAARQSSAGFGYTSTHAAVAAAIATVAFVTLRGWWRWIAVALGLLVGGARLYVGVHYPLDVLGGAALGVLVGTVASALVR